MVLGAATACAFLEATGSGAVATVTFADDAGCTGMSFGTQVGTVSDYPDVDSPADWELGQIWHATDPASCMQCAPTPPETVLASDASGSWAWVDGELDLQLTVAFDNASEVTEVVVSGLAPQICF